MAFNVQDSSEQCLTGLHVNLATKPSSGWNVAFPTRKESNTAVAVVL